jgi:hypothetical protein
MTNRYLSGRTAILAAALGSLASFSACDVPNQATPATETVDANAELISAQPEPERANPDQVYIEGITTNGMGCPKGDSGTVSTVISEDKKSFILSYRDMQLENPSGPEVKHLACQAVVELHVPNGFQVAIASVNARGYLYLDEDIQARQTSSYFFAGVPLGLHPNSTTVGPYDDFYDFNDTIPFSSLVWSKCGTSVLMGINSALDLNAKENPDGQAIFSTDVTDGRFQTVLHWKIKSC